MQHVLEQVSKDIGVAREHGDLKENAEWHAARERQGMLTARSKHIEQALFGGVFGTRAHPLHFGFAGLLDTTGSQS